MARPVQNASIVRRYRVDRPQLRDSEVRFTNKSLEELKRQYGSRLLEVVEYKRGKVIHSAARSSSSSG